MSGIAKTPLRRARERCGLTIQQLASSVGIDPGNLSRIERGIQVPGRDLAQRLSRHFDGALTEMEIIYPERYADAA